jgi:hypothetical protein
MAIDRKKGGHQVAPEMERKIRDSVGSIVEFAIKNYGNEKLDTLNQFREVAGWYNEAADGKLSRSEALATVSNHIIEKLIDQVSSYLQKAMINGLGIKLGNSKEKMIEKIEVKIAFEHDMEFAKQLEIKDVASCKVTFEISGSGKLEGVKIHHVSDRTEFEISKFSVPISISITKIKLEVAGLPLPRDTLLLKPIPILDGSKHKVLQFENYSFNI